MNTEMRKTGVESSATCLGTHFVSSTRHSDLLKQRLLLQGWIGEHEFCLWVVAEPLAVEDARRALQRPYLTSMILADHSIELSRLATGILQDGTFDLTVIGGWNEKLARASARGYAGVRVTGDTAWLEKKDWKDFCEYEESSTRRRESAPGGAMHVRSPHAELLKS